jgi:uncharacterized membrane protein YfcA
MELWDLLLFFILTLLCEIIGTISGFGSSVVFVPLASFFFDVTVVLGLTACFHVLSNIIKLFFFKKNIDWNILLKLGIPATVFVTIGAILTKFIDPKFIEIALGIVLIIVSTVLMLGDKIKLQRTNFNLISGGILSGFFAGLVGTGGSIRGVTMAAFNLEKEIFISTSAGIDFSVDISRTIIYYLNGFIQVEMLYFLPILFISSIIGTWIGKKLLDKISQKTFVSITLTTIITSSIIHLIKLI